MQIKLGQSLGDVFIKSIDDDTYHKFCKVESIELQPNEKGEIRLSDDRVLITGEPLTLSCPILNKNGLLAFTIFALTGNDLYLRFPKKLRRKKRGRRWDLECPFM